MSFLRHASQLIVIFHLTVKLFFCKSKNKKPNNYFLSNNFLLEDFLCHRKVILLVSIFQFSQLWLLVVAMLIQMLKAARLTREVSESGDM